MASYVCIYYNKIKEWIIYGTCSDRYLPTSQSTQYIDEGLIRSNLE